MFKGLRDGFFALGLVLGIGIAVILLLFLEYHSPPIDGYSSTNTHCAAQEYQCQDEHGGWPYWGYWFRRLISTEDSLAQWIMMVFTIAGAWLLYLTLKASRSMASDAREIGEAQVRAYLTIDKVELTVQVEPEGVLWRFTISVRNSGQSPAHDIKAWVRSREFSAVAPKWGYMPDLASGGEGNAIALGGTYERDLKFHDKDQTTVHFAATVGVSFFDVFGRLNKHASEGELWLGFVTVVNEETFSLTKKGVRVGRDFWKNEEK